jgi:hypothetical protein
MNLSNINQTQNQDEFGKIRWHHSGSTTTGDATTRILIFNTELRYSTNELPKLPRARLQSNLKWASGRTHVFLWPRVL